MRKTHVWKMFYKFLFQINFLRSGSALIWTPYVIVGAAMVCLIAFLFFTVHAKMKALFQKTNY